MRVRLQHDGAVAVLAEADELVVLADDLATRPGEVEREGGLVGAEVVDVEDRALWAGLWVEPPDDPPTPGRRGRICARRR